ncbi:UNVERIFIED_CONTAM: hypothetical protein GTU68_036449, partial [Idotea baltica]|nr:hypothetical protein [Idotea baltica]
TVHKDKKIEQVAYYKDVFASTQVVFISHNKGLTVNQDRELRGKIKGAGAKYGVAKNNLLKLAIKGTDFEALADQLSGPTTISYAEEPVALAKQLTEFSKDNENLEMIAGFMDGELLDVNSIKKLATLPSLDELRGKIVGL